MVYVTVRDSPLAAYLAPQPGCCAMLYGLASLAIRHGLLKPRRRQRSVGRKRDDVEIDEPALNGAQSWKSTANGRRHDLVRETLAVVVDVEIGPKAMSRRLLKFSGGSVVTRAPFWVRRPFSEIATS
jgi:hypothetical protein